jgi:2-dehydro-3-deoxygalactonokinase
MQQQYLLGCDWGTSSFRLRLFDIHSQIVKAEISTREGVAATYRAWQQNSKQHDPSSCELFFRTELKKQIDLMSLKVSADLDHILVILSGMASSSIGMRNVPYSNVPFALDGSSAEILKINADDMLHHDIVLVSGVKTDHDVLRGEETQLLGLIALLKDSNQYKEESILVFPGTHSKHIYIQDEAMVNFKTYMTGEIYSLLGNHSILRDSVDITKLTMKSNEDKDVFREGVRASLDACILHQLFSVRTNNLFELFDLRQNAFYLSGLLIGSELKCLSNQKDLPVYLCSSSNLHDFYEVAIDELGMLERSIILPMEMMDRATITGQFLLYKKTNSLLNAL